MKYKILVLMVLIGLTFVSPAHAQSTTIRVTDMNGFWYAVVMPWETLRLKIEVIGPVNLKGYSLMLCPVTINSDAKPEPIWEYVLIDIFPGPGSWGRSASDIGACVNMGVDGDGSVLNGGGYELGQAEYQLISGSGETHLRVVAAKMVQGQGVIQSYSDIVFEDMVVWWYGW